MGMVALNPENLSNHARMRYNGLLVLLLAIMPWIAVSALEREEDHQALRVLMTDLTLALNEHRAADLFTHLDHECSLTFVDQLIVHNKAELVEAFETWFGPNAQLASVRFAPVVERGAVFTGPDTAWASGRSDDVYTMTDGRSGEMTANWTATVVRRDGVWKLSTLHAGVDPMTNPVVNMVTSAAKRWTLYAGIACALLGLVLGFIGARLVRRS